MPRQPNKCREWEKERRERLNTSFSSLNKLLPSYDPSINRSKSDILQSAVDYVVELQEKVKNLLSGDVNNKPVQDEMKKLYSRIKKLLTRNEQLSKLLQDAGIRVPSECGSVKKFRDGKKWAHRITPDQAKEFAAKLQSQKEIEPKKVKSNRKKKQRPPRKSKSKKDCKLKPKSAIIISDTIISNAPNPQSCYIIRNVPTCTIARSLCATTGTVVTPSTLLSAPLVASSVKSSEAKARSKVNASLSSLGPGTLILANGNIVPILPQAPILPTQAIIHPPPIIVNPAPSNNATLFIVPNNISKNVNKPVDTKTCAVPMVTTTITTKIASIISKSYTNIKPKIGITKTTQMNKVPIPALSSQYSSNSNVRSNKIVIHKKLPDKKLVEKSESMLKENKSKKSTAPEDRNKRSAPDKIDPSSKRLKAADDVSEKVTQSKNSCNKKSAVSSHSIDSLCNEKNPKLQTALVEQPKTQEIKETPKANSDAEIPKDVVATETSSAVIPEINDPHKMKDLCESVELSQSKAEEAATETVKFSAIDPKKIVEVLPILNIEDAMNPPSDTQKSETTPQIAPKESDKTLDTCSKPDAKIIDNETAKLQKDELQLQTEKNLQISEENLVHSELSNDIFASLQVPTGSQNPESTSPTAAFLLAFPLVSTLTGVKVTEVNEEETVDSRNGTPTLLQIGAIDAVKPVRAQTESLTPNLLNLDSFTFFSSKDMCNSFYQPFESIVTTSTGPSVTTVTTANATICNTLKVVASDKSTLTNRMQTDKVAYEPKKLDAQTKPVYSSSTVKMTNKVQVKPNPHDVSFMGQPNNYNSIYAQSYCNVQTNPTLAVPSKLYPQQSLKAKSNDDKISCRQQYSTAANKNYANEHYNTFNPFTDISKTIPCSYDASKPYNEPLYSSNTNYNYNYQNENNFDGYSSAKVAKNERPHYAVPYEASYMDYKNADLQNHFYNQASGAHDKSKFHTSKAVKTTNTQPRPPVNWMTAPDVKQQSTDFLVSQFAKDVDFSSNSIYPSSSFAPNSQSTYFNANAPIYPTPDNNFDNRKAIETAFPTVPPNTFSRNETEENHFSWSPTKLPQLLDPPGFVTATLPTLVGDLALGTTQQITFSDPKSDSAKHPQRLKETSRRSKQQSYESQSNFLSVSQLVDHSKPPALSGRVSSRRNSGNRASKTNLPQQKTKRAQKQAETKEPQILHNQNYAKSVHLKHQSYAQESPQVANDWDNKHLNRQILKNNYSAEALIAHQHQPEGVMIKSRNNQQPANFPSTKSLSVPAFLSDNILPYFPTVDLPGQDNGFIQQNSNYQTSSFSHNFASTNTYSASSLMQTTITSSYLPSSNFIPEIAPHDYNPIIGDNVNIFSHSNTRVAESKPYKSNKQVTNSTHRGDDKRHLPPANNNFNNMNTFAKKAKKKQTNENNLPGLVDFSFLSMPSAINSPILPDDFPTHSNFLPPPTSTQIYPCKNPLYSKQGTDMPSGSLLPMVATGTRSNMQPDISPTMNNAGTSLTNFNLSTIFPEINKGPSSLLDMYSDPNRNKEFSLQKNYFPATTHNPFASKPTFTSSYINTTTQSFSS